jgi:hypothetical protein
MEVLKKQLSVNESSRMNHYKMGNHVSMELEEDPDKAKTIFIKR